MWPLGCHSKSLYRRFASVSSRFLLMEAGQVLTFIFVSQTQQLQMLAMSNPNVNPGSIETQQMQIKAPAGVRSFPPLLVPFHRENC